MPNPATFIATFAVAYGCLLGVGTWLSHGLLIPRGFQVGPLLNLMAFAAGLMLAKRRLGAERCAAISAARPEAVATACSVALIAVAADALVMAMATSLFSGKLLLPAPHRLLLLGFIYWAASYYDFVTAADYERRAEATQQQ